MTYYMCFIQTLIIRCTVYYMCFIQTLIIRCTVYELQPVESSTHYYLTVKSKVNGLNVN